MHPFLDLGRNISMTLLRCSYSLTERYFQKDSSSYMHYTVIAAFVKIR